MFKVTNLKDKLPNNSTISASDCGGLKRPKVKLSLWSMIFSGGLGKARNLSFVFWKIATLQYSTTFKEIHLLSLLSQQKFFIFIASQRAWILDVMLIALVSKITLLEWLSKFAQCWVPRESVLQGSSMHKARCNCAKFKSTLIDQLLKLTLLSLHQIFRP